MEQVRQAVGGTDPDGAVGVLKERILAPAREVIALEALPHARLACEILPSFLGSHIGDVAALMAA